MSTHHEKLRWRRRRCTNEGFPSHNDPFQGEGSRVWLDAFEVLNHLYRNQKESMIVENLIYESNAYHHALRSVEERNLECKTFSNATQICAPNGVQSDYFQQRKEGIK